MNPIKIAFILVQVVGIIILIVSLLYTMSQKPSALQRNLIVLFSNSIFSFAAYIVEIAAPNVEVGYVAAILGYLSKPFAMLSTLILLLQYSHIKIKNWVLISFAIYFIALSCVVFTDPLHHLYYTTNIGYKENSPGSPLIVGHGPFWYVYMASTFLLFAGYTYVCVREFLHAKTKQAKVMAAYMYASLFFAIAGLAVYVTGKTMGFDTTLVGMLLGSITLLILLSKYRLFDSLTLAQEKLMSDGKDGVVVLDGRNTISYFTPITTSILPLLNDCKNYKDEVEAIRVLMSFEEGNTIKCNDRIYQFHRREVLSRNKKIIVGKYFIFSDITDHFYYQERLKRDVEDKTSQIKDMQRQILISFANLVEARDLCTGSHVKNVAETVKLIAEELALDPKYQSVMTEQYITILEETAPLHDVGKIFIPDAILNKPAKLTKDEYEIIKTHPEKGLEVLKSSIEGVEAEEYVNTAKEIVYSHHERWDGSGYPQGLKGEQIPISARIMAVADVYDALMSERPYKEAYSFEKAIETIKEEVGTHFDPEVVNAFLIVAKRFNCGKKSA